MEYKCTDFYGTLLSIKSKTHNNRLPDKLFELFQINKSHNYSLNLIHITYLLHSLKVNFSKNDVYEQRHTFITRDYDNNVTLFHKLMSLIEEMYSNSSCNIAHFFSLFEHTDKAMHNTFISDVDDSFFYQKSLDNHSDYIEPYFYINYNQEHLHLTCSKNNITEINNFLAPKVTLSTITNNDNNDNLLTFFERYKLFFSQAIIQKHLYNTPFKLFVFILNYVKTIKTLLTKTDFYDILYHKFVDFKTHFEHNHSWHEYVDQYIRIIPDDELLFNLFFHLKIITIDDTIKNSIITDKLYSSLMAPFILNFNVIFFNTTLNPEIQSFILQYIIQNFLAEFSLHDSSFFKEKKNISNPVISFYINSKNMVDHKSNLSSSVQFNFSHFDSVLSYIFNHDSSSHINLCFSNVNILPSLAGKKKRKHKSRKPRKPRKPRKLKKTIKKTIKKHA